MAKRHYELKDIYDYLLEYYNIEWLGYKIVDAGLERHIQNHDFEDQTGSQLRVKAIVYNGSKRQIARIYVSNQSLRVSVDRKPLITWKAFLAQRYNQEQTLNK